MSCDELVERFLAQGRIDHFDCMLAKKIAAERVSWLALWVIRAFRFGITSPEVGEKLVPSPLSLFVDEQFIPPSEKECEVIEESIREEFASFSFDGLIVEPPFVFLAYGYAVEKALSSNVDRLSKALPFVSLNLPEGLEFVNNDQEQAIVQACGHTLFLITGGPGTGKTYTAGTYLRHVATTVSHPLKVALVAPTGRAVQALENSISRFASGSISVRAHTIHSLIYPKRQSMLPFHLMIIDECSMIDSDLMCRLLERAHGGMRILMLGDVDQLPPIEPGRPFEKMLSKHPSCILRKCQRTDVHDILDLASLIRGGEGEKVGEWLTARSSPEVVFHDFKTLNQLSDFYQFVDKEVTSVWRGASSHNLFRVKSSVCLTPIRRGPLGTEAINERVAGSLQKQKVEPVVVCRNAPNLHIMNGEMGLLKKGEEVIIFSQGTIPSSLCPEVEKAYAMTVHKSQGSEFDTVLFVLPPRAYVDRRLLYTAVTRAKKRLVIVADIDDLVKAVDKS